MRLARFFLCCFMALFLSRESYSEENARTIMEQVKTNATANFEQARIELTDFDRNGNTIKTQKMVFVAKHKGAGYFDSLFVFTDPKRMSGSWFLTNESGVDAQYFYTEQFRRMVRVASGDGGKPFFGTWFAQEDVKSEKLAEWEYSIIDKDEPAGVVAIAAVPKKESQSSYSRRVLTIDIKHNVPLRIEYFRRDKLYKVQENSNIVDVDGRSRATSYVMRNSDGEGTRAVFENIRLGIESPKWMFDSQELRGRNPLEGVKTILK